MTHQLNPLQPLLSSITIAGSGRVGPTIAALIGLTGTTIGAIALARSRRRTDANTETSPADGWSRAIAAVALGVISLVLGGVFLAAADGGPGTGNGVVGSAAAIGLGLIAIVLGGLAWARGRQIDAARTRRPGPTPLSNTRDESRTH